MIGFINSRTYSIWRDQWHSFCKSVPEKSPASERRNLWAILFLSFTVPILSSKDVQIIQNGCGLGGNLVALPDYFSTVVKLKSLKSCSMLIFMSCTMPALLHTHTRIYMYMDIYIHTHKCVWDTHSEKACINCKFSLKIPIIKCILWENDDNVSWTRVGLTHPFVPEVKKKEKKKEICIKCDSTSIFTCIRLFHPHKKPGDFLYQFNKWNEQRGSKNLNNVTKLHS